MSAIRALGGAATQATIYPATQAGYDAAVADLTASGGVIELSTGLEAINLGTIPSTVVVLRMRTTPSPSIEIAHDLVLSNYDAVHGSSNLRMSDSAGTLRTVLSALATDVLRIAYLASGGLTITDQNGNIKATVTGTRIAPASGVDFAPNSLPGTSGQVLVSAGAAASPVWTNVGGLPGSNNTIGQQAVLWDTGPSNLTVGGVIKGRYTSMGSGSVTSVYTLFTVPSNFTTVTAWKVLFVQTVDFTNTVAWRLSALKYTDGMDFTAVNFTDGATTQIAAPAAANTLKIGTMGAPAITMTAGERWWFRASRVGTSDSNTGATDFMGVELNYT